MLNSFCSCHATGISESSHKDKIDLLGHRLAPGWLTSICLRTFAGTPPATTLAGKECVTRLPAATRVFSPIVTPLSTVTLTPSQTPFSIVTGASGPVRGSSVCQSVSVINVLAPHCTLSPKTILVAQPITVPLKPQLAPILIVAPSLSVDIMQGWLMPIRLEVLLERNSQLSAIMMRLPGWRRKFGNP